jgi:hypothetical protein
MQNGKSRDTEQRQTKQKTQHRKLKRLTTRVPHKNPVMNTCDRDKVSNIRVNHFCHEK